MHPLGGEGDIESAINDRDEVAELSQGHGFVRNRTWE